MDTTVTKLFIPIGASYEQLELIDTVYRFIYRQNLCEDYHFGVSVDDPKETRLKGIKKHLGDSRYVTINLGGIPSYSSKTETPTILWNYRFTRNHFERFEKETVDFEEVKAFVSYFIST